MYRWYSAHATEDVMAQQVRYSVEMLSEGGRWVRLASFGSALDADRLFEMLVRSGA